MHRKIIYFTYYNYAVKTPAFLSKRIFYLPGFVISVISRLILAGI